MRYFLLPLLALFLFISGCSDKKVEDHVFKEKTDTIQKAKEVEQLIQDAANKHQQHIDEQGR